jgi:Sel1 repeat
MLALRLAEHVELLRIEKVQRGAIESGLVIYAEHVVQCSICFDNIPMRHSTLIYACCGAVQCLECVERHVEAMQTHEFGSRSTTLIRCPFCRYNEQQDVNLLRRNATEGKARAQRTLGLWMQHGKHGVEKYCFQAQKWYKLAADQEDADAMLHFGHLWPKGFPECVPPVPPSEELANEYMEMAAKHGSAAAQHYIACIESSVEHAMVWHTLAAAQGIEFSQCYLGEIM